MLINLVAAETSIFGRLVRMERSDITGTLRLAMVLAGHDRPFMVAVPDTATVRPGELAERLGSVVELMCVSIRRPDTLTMVAFRCHSLGEYAGGDPVDAMAQVAAYHRSVLVPESASERETGWDYDFSGDTSPG